MKLIFSKALLACVLIVVFMCTLFTLFGYNTTWELWGIPIMSPHFADLRTITCGADAYKMGIDPMIENQTDPWQRKLNYPRIWQSLYLLGINESHTTAIGIMIIFLFLCGIYILMKNVNNLTIYLIIGAVLSPATILAVERANIDLLMFFLLSLSIFLVNRHYLFSSAIIFILFLLKLYPFFGFILLLKFNKNIVLKLFFLIFTLALLYIILTYSDLVLMNNNTPKIIYRSFGINVFWMKVMSINQSMGIFIKYFSYFLIMFSFPIIYFGLKSTFCPLETVHEYKSYIDAFRIGSAIYIGTFLMGNNFDYRLIFLIFTIPYLIFLANKSIVNISLISKFSILFVFLSLWYMFIKRFTGIYVSFIVDEFSNWFIFLVLLVFL